MLASTSYVTILNKQVSLQLEERRWKLFTRLSEEPVLSRIKYKKLLKMFNEEEEVNESPSDSEMVSLTAKVLVTKDLAAFVFLKYIFSIIAMLESRNPIRTFEQIT